MAGHSHWAGIKHKKAIVDAKKGKVFSKIAKHIMIAARHGGGDPNANLSLKYACEKARAANMPLDNITRAIKKGTGELEGVNYEEITYEGYGPGGVALFIECLTDNLNRTVAEVRYILEKNGGNLGQAGSVAWQFDRKGMIYINSADFEEDRVFEAAIEAGAEDVALQDDEFVLTTEATGLHEVQAALKDAGLAIGQAELTMVAKNEVAVTGGDAERLLRVMDLLDDHDDVQKVHTNGDIDESVLAELS